MMRQWFERRLVALGGKIAVFFAEIPHACGLLVSAFSSSL
jgi:hypothetical protein